MTCPLPPPLLHSIAWGIFLIGMLGAWGLCSWIATRKLFSWRHENDRAMPEDASAVASEGEDMDQQLSLIEAMEAKESALDQVVENNREWMGRAIAAFEDLPAAEATGEDIRFALIEAGLPQPRTVQAWGALINTLVKRGALKWTGEMRPMRAKGANSRRTFVYERVAIAKGGVAA